MRKSDVCQQEKLSRLSGGGQYPHEGLGNDMVEKLKDNAWFKKHRNVLLCKKEQTIPIFCFCYSSM